MLHPDVPEALRGTVAALAHPAILDHLTRLGVDAVELMPITAWIDERHLGPLGLTNGWGYNPVAFMALDPRLCPGGIAELRRHRRGAARRRASASSSTSSSTTPARATPTARPCRLRGLDAARLLPPRRPTAGSSTTPAPATRSPATTRRRAA